MVILTLLFCLFSAKMLWPGVVRVSRITAPPTGNGLLRLGVYRPAGERGKWQRNLWWRHQVETFSALLALCEGSPLVSGRNPLVTGGFPSQRPVMQSFDGFFDLCMNKQLSKQSRRRWFEMPSRALWCHCNVNLQVLVLNITYNKNS